MLAMRLSQKKLVAGLDLARRRDHSALVLLDVEPDRLTVSAALRLPQAPLRQQFALIGTAPRRRRPPGLRSERPRRRCRGIAAEDTAARRHLPDRRRSLAHPLAARRPFNRWQVVPDPAARCRHAERRVDGREARARPRAFAPGACSVCFQAERARPVSVGGGSRPRRPRDRSGARRAGGGSRGHSKFRTMRRYPIAVRAEGTIAHRVLALTLSQVMTKTCGAVAGDR
jgi:hypothetical protein